MPRIAEFFGIYVYMYFDDAQKHHNPHIHVHHGEHKAVYDIQNTSRLSGYVKPRQHRLIIKWINKRQEALMDNWDRSLVGEKLNWIAPI